MASLPSIEGGGAFDHWFRRVSAAARCAAPEAPLAAITDPYLGTRYRDDPGAGCLLAALGPDLPRRGPGALVLARAVDDDALSREILDTVREDVAR